MSYRFVRILLFFDLPTTTSSDLKQYRKFRQYLISNGFVMIQESVYVRLFLNLGMAKYMCNNLVKNKPLLFNFLLTNKMYVSEKKSCDKYYKIIFYENY